MPRGGVNNPISTAIIVTIPNQTRSTFIETKTGNINGTKINIIEELSKIVPIKITRATYVSITPQYPMSKFTTKFPNSAGTPDKASIREYI